MVAGTGAAITRSGLQRTSRSGDGAAALVSDSDLAVGAASAGSRSLRLVPSVVGWIRRTVWLDRRAWILRRPGVGGRYGSFAPLHNGMRYSNIANMRDGHVSRALSAVNAGHFGAGRVSAVAATREQVSGARMMAGNLPVVPSRSSLSASGRAAAPSTIRNTSQSFYGSHNNAARPASFQQQTSNLHTAIDGAEPCRRDSRRRTVERRIRCARRQ